MQGLESERLLLEDLVPGHAAELFPVLRDPEMYTYIPGDPPSSETELRERYTRQTNHAAEDELWLNWILRLKEGRECIGYVQATLPKASSALIAYQLSPRFWGKGYAFEACGAVLARLATVHSVREIRAEIDSRNTASIRLVERLGFRREAFRERADFFKGSWSDEIVFVLQLESRT
ncbi:MAG TPA: GNAT family N-acetyltransferase [Rectinemataceae bacterium]|nr:GNAT family N-acetyltransferase [Rectinemataceae bacterium]